MDVTPSQVSNASFRTVRKGYEPTEVTAFLADVAVALEDAQQQATAMEARARAAVARLQEMAAAEEASSAVAAVPAEVPVDSESSDRSDSSGVHVGADDAEIITRTLLLAQRTADTTINEAQTEADQIRGEARTDADATIDSTREMAAQLLDDARNEARKASEAERRAAENEVQSLVARREFLVGDVDQLEQFLGDQRERLRAAAHQIEALCERVPSGLGQASAPALSAADDSPGDDTAELFRPAGVEPAGVDAAGVDAAGVDAAGVDADRSDVPVGQIPPPG